MTLEADGWERDGRYWLEPLKYWHPGDVARAAKTTDQALMRMAEARRQDD